MSISFPRTIAWAVWMTASVFYAYQYILRVMPNIMLADIMQQFGITSAMFGQFSGVYYIGYSLMHLPLGIMLDRYGPRKMMTLCILMMVAGLMPLLFAEHWIYPIGGRFLIGLGSSAAILSVFKITRMMFNEKQFSRMLSLSVTIGLIGAIYGGGPISYMREVFGYDAVIQMVAGIGLVLAIATYWIIPDLQNSSSGTVKSNIKEVLTNSKVIWSCLFAGLMVGPLEGFADVWGTVFLKQAYGLEGTLAASLPSTIFIGMCFGGPLLSWMGDKIGFIAAIICAGIGMTVCFVTLLAWHLPSSILTLNFAFLGICSAYQILAIYKASTYVREEVAGLTTAIANMIIMIFGYAFHSIIGQVVNEMGGPHLSQALIYGIIVIPIALCLGSAGYISLFFLEKRKEKELKSLKV